MNKPRQQVGSTSVVAPAAKSTASPNVGTFAGMLSTINWDTVETGVVTVLAGTAIVGTYKLASAKLTKQHVEAVIKHPHFVRYLTIYSEVTGLGMILWLGWQMSSNPVFRRFDWPLIGMIAVGRYVSAYLAPFNALNVVTSFLVLLQRTVDESARPELYQTIIRGYRGWLLLGLWQIASTSVALIIVASMVLR